MPRGARHCPFLNRSDARCATHLSLGGLTDAFDHCFDRYPTCGAYRELLAERRTRRGEPAGPDGGWPEPRAESSDGSPIVPLTVTALGTLAGQSHRVSGPAA